VLKPAGVATSWQLLVHLNYCRLPGLSHNRFGASSKGRHIYRQTKLPTGMVDDFHWGICSLEGIFLTAGPAGQISEQPNRRRVEIRVVSCGFVFAALCLMLRQDLTGSSKPEQLTTLLTFVNKKQARPKAELSQSETGSGDTDRRAGRCFILTRPRIACDVTSVLRETGCCHC
jgi:hypothetical protein